ncbi:hypothetical protein D1832_13700 [Dermacoccus abyssi]|uniref:Uncharacterized protein n=1 Tax=Dermacoccus abyssi TaxID=322596 RepID=A0A417Z0V4_9MICO|nr:hypothetical protein D1832_13700 [Dermacoccus abyssi]
MVGGEDAARPTGPRRVPRHLHATTSDGMPLQQTVNGPAAGGAPRTSAYQRSASSKSVTLRFASTPAMVMSSSGLLLPGHTRAASVAR